MKNAVFWDVTPCDCCKNPRAKVLLRATQRKFPENGILQEEVESESSLLLFSPEPVIILSSV
jgi:hypothetical protein